jgi:pimeloyl-ACP methyl ester carboxylesterase
MFTRLTNTSKAAIFSVLVLCMAVGAALLIRFLGISSNPVIFSIWSCTPTLAALIMLLVVTRDGYSREGWKSLGLHRLGLNVWWIAFGLTLLITVAASAIVWATPLASFTWPEGGIIDPIISFFIFFGMSVVWFVLAEEIGMRGYLQPRLMSLGRTAALVVVGLVFATWHMPLIFLARGAERNALLYVRFVQRSRRRAVGQYLELPGVRTSYEVEGQGEPVVLLLGGFCTNETWGPQRADFAADHRTFLPERRAHGHTPDVEGPLSYNDMAQDTIDFLTSVVGGPTHLVGWSDGGIVALLVAIARPDLVQKIVVTGANFKPASELGMAEALDELTAEAPEMAMFRTMYEAASPDGSEHWPVVVGKMAEMSRAEPDISIEDLGHINAPTLILVGDDDFIPLEHTIELYRAIPHSELAVVPGTSHGHFMEKPSLVNRIVLDFLDQPSRPHDGAASSSHDVG